MNKHVLYVPTHRPAPEAIDGYIHEAAFLSELLGQTVPFVLIEARPGPWVEHHADLVRQLGSERGVRTHHVTPESFDRFLGAILARLGASHGESLHLARLVQPRGTAYGAGPNKAALIGAALGALVLHRRDSDTAPAVRDGVRRFPGELDVQAIGKPLRDVALRGEIQDRGDIVYLAASAYRGDPPIDRRSLFEAGREFVRGLEALASPGASEADMNAFLDEYFIGEPGRDHDEDFLQLDGTAKAEMGVSCLFQVWRELPEMPILDTLGCDYVHKNLLYKLGRPVVFHSRKVLHRYDVTRTGPRPEVAASYALRELRQLILARVWTGNKASLTTGVLMSPDGRMSNEGFSFAMEQARASADRPALRELVGQFARVYGEAAAATTGDLAAMLAATATAAHEAGESLVDDVLTGIDDFCHLIRMWPRLIDCAQQCSAALD